MQQFTEKIAQQSKVILIFAKITRILLYVALSVTVFLLISTWISDGSPIFKMGNTEVYMTIPLGRILGVELGAQTARQLADLRMQLFGQLFAFIVSLIMLTRITRMFKRIRDTGHPFTAEVVKSMKVFAVLLGLVIAVQNTIVGVVVALVIFAFAMIFQYGAQLQNQADETL